MTESPPRLPRSRPDVRLRDEGHKVSLELPGLGTSYGLNPTARAIWELCDGATRVEEMVDAICEVFAVPPARAHEDVKTVLAQFDAAELLEWSKHPEAES
jgi:hypothetical protein